MTKESPEARLVRRCLEGNPEAIRWLVTHYQDDVFSLCVRLLRHRQDAEDVCQEVFLRVYRSLRTWDNSRPLRPWIMGIAVNRCRCLETMTPIRGDGCKDQRSLNPHPNMI
ncbi:MAG: RNA polymerase sigma factor, partial [Gemmataceae bacterium]